jgi:hypothetical protein|tara:strand:+ start:87 stop:317 length:231 start_codon:yes stop_codon:yes gene_type:complete
MANTSRENRLEELGRVDAEKAHTRKGRRNLRDEKRRIVSGLRGGGIAKRGKGLALKDGGKVSSRGIATKGFGIETH